MRRKFSSPAKAARSAKALGMKAKRGAKCVLADGRKGAWYTLTKAKKKKR